jgi:hypothetical protein
LYQFLFQLVFKLIVPFVKELILHKKLSPADKRKRMVVLSSVMMLVGLVYFFSNYTSRAPVVPDVVTPIERPKTDHQVEQDFLVLGLERKILSLERELDTLKSSRPVCEPVSIPANGNQYRTSPYERYLQLRGE